VWFICHVVKSLLVPTLTSAANATVSPASLASASVVVTTAIVLVVHLVPLLRVPLPASGRRAWSVVLALAAVKPKEVDVAAFDLQFCLGTILCLFHSVEYDAVALHVPLTSLILHPVLRRVVMLIYGGGHARALPLEPHHLQLAPEKSILGVHLLFHHFQCRVIPGDNASAAFAVIIFHDFFSDFFIKRPCVDCANEREQVAILGHLHLILTLLHCAIHSDHHAGAVVRTISIVGYCKGVGCLYGEVASGDPERLGGGGRRSLIILVH
jgi:hypothetical protein